MVYSLTTTLLMAGLVFSDMVFSAGDNKEKIQWAVVHWPPIMILHGPDKGQGVADRLLALSQAEMSGYEYDYLPVTWQRFWLEVEKKSPVCNATSRKTPEREKVAVFSLPAGAYSHAAIIVRKSDLHKWEGARSQSLSEVVQNGGLNGVIEKSRNYGPYIEAALSGAGEHHGLERKSKNPVSTIEMLQLGRIDYTVEFPMVANYIAKKSQLDVELASISISESPLYGVSYVACPDNEWGRKVVHDFNGFLLKVYDQPELLAKLYGNKRDDEGFMAYTQKLIAEALQSVSELGENQSQDSVQ